MNDDSSSGGSDEESSEEEKKLKVRSRFVGKRHQSLDVKFSSLKYCDGKMVRNKGRNARTKQKGTTKNKKGLMFNLDQEVFDKKTQKKSYNKNTLP